MQARCPNCDALLHSGEMPSDGQFPAKCWMCMTAVTPSAAAVKPVPRTVVRQPAEPPERRSAAKFDRASGSDTKSLEIPPGKAINICVVSGVSQGMEFELSRPLTRLSRNLFDTSNQQIDLDKFLAPAKRRRRVRANQGVNEFRASNLRPIIS
jgi:hypothetical protein